MNPLDRPVGLDDEPRLCRKLRCKGAWDVEAAGQSWKHGHSTTGAYWCLSTMEAFGPDDAPCHPHHCGQERACYQPDDRDIVTAPPRIA